jgi:hypothetical protein
MFGKCKGCEILKQENAYLRKFIDSLLLKLNMQQIEAPAEKISGVKEPGEEEIQLGPHAERFGLVD